MSTHPFGYFRGTVQVEWLDDPDGRKMRLLTPLVYVDPSGREWDAPAGWEIDGASIPRFFWTTIGSPYSGRYRRASVIHDVACDRRTVPWEMVHRCFYNAMRADAVDPVLAKTMYAAVYHKGPRWPLTLNLRDITFAQAREEEDKLMRVTAAQSDRSFRLLQREAPRVEAPDAPVVDFEARIEPPVTRITDQEFEQLRHHIAACEVTEAGGISLEEIEAYQPAR